MDQARRILRDGSPAAGTLLTTRSPVLRRRPAPGVWSPLEYGAHLRDVLTAQRERVVVALLEATPHFAPLYREERVSLLGYNHEDSEHVALGLSLGAELFERLGATLTEAQLDRSCTYNLPEPTLVDVRWVFVHTAHEVQHHLGDIERGLSGADGGAG